MPDDVSRTVLIRNFFRLIIILLGNLSYELSQSENDQDNPNSISRHPLVQEIANSR